MNKRVRPKGLGSFLYGGFEKPPRNITRGKPSVLHQSHSPRVSPSRARQEIGGLRQTGMPGNRGAYVRPGGNDDDMEEGGFMEKNGNVVLSSYFM